MKKTRESSIELLKIFAMFLIVISHVTQTLYTENNFFSSDYILNIKESTTSFQKLILVWFSSFGAQGNLIFFISSAWFLLESKKVDDKKIISIMADVWIINIMILVIFKLVKLNTLNLKTIIYCLFPNMFSLNWYVTCYLLFYLIHVTLNKIIYEKNKKELLVTNIILLYLYYVVNYLNYGLFFVSNLVTFIVIYFLIAYLKLYLKDYCQNLKKNKKIFYLTVLVTPILILITNILGQNISLFRDKLLHWGGNNSPFLLVTAISLFIIFKEKKYKSKVINNISSLTLIIYVIHENYLIRTYIRPYIWKYIYKKYTYKYVVLQDMLYAILLFIISTILAFLYKKILQKIIHNMSTKIYIIMKKKICKKINCIIKK